MTSDPVVFEDVSAAYERPTVCVVRDFDLTIHAGEFFCLVGPSGCGKSTVLKMIAGIVAPLSGRIVKPERVGMVFQSYALLPWLSVEENVAFARRMLGDSDDEARDKAEHYLAMVHLEGFATKYPRDLSGGQRQRVGIARALAADAGVLLLDEPFSALDPVMVDELHGDLLQIWAATKKTIVMVSHHFLEASILADRVGVMKDGRLVTIQTIDLPRPRREDDVAVVTAARDIRTCLERTENAER